MPKSSSTGDVPSASMAPVSQTSTEPSAASGGTDKGRPRSLKVPRASGSSQSAPVSPMMDSLEPSEKAQSSSRAASRGSSEPAAGRDGVRGQEVQADVASRRASVEARCSGHSASVPDLERPASSALDIEQRFEDDFTDHLRKRNLTQKVTFGAVGAGIGGVVGVAASSFFLPGLAVAAVVGGGGGYIWAKRKGKRDKHRHTQSDEAEPQEQARPSFTRLKYLVKWGHWQLEYHEDENPEYRCLVLDEVVRAFSPWVQRMYLLRATGITNEAHASCREVFQRLAPLYYFLQRRAPFEAVIEEVKVVAAAFDATRADEVAGERCRVIFPTIMETISILDRLSQATKEQLIRDLGLRRDQEPGPFGNRKSSKRLWLQRIVDAILSVLVRKDVQEALANPRLLHQASDQAQLPEADHDFTGDETQSDDCCTPRIKVVPVVPPEGAEEEHTDSLEVEYFSMSGESENEGSGTSAPSGVRRSRSHRSIPGNKDAVEGVNFKERLRRFPRGDGDHQWQAFDQSTFLVRSASYLSDKKKAPSGPSMLELLSVDWIMVPSSGPIYRTTLSKDFCYANSRQDGERRFLLVQNWVFPPYQCVFTCALDPQSLWVTASDSPQALLWQRFLEMDSAEQVDLIKVIMSCENGPWLVKHAIPRKPLIVGRKVKMQTYHQPGDFLEVVVDVATGKGDQVAVGIVLKALNRLTLAFTSVIEGRSEDELPEAGLFAASITNLNLAKVPYPDVSS